MIDAIGSLCSGVGGLDRAVSALLRLPVAWHCENADGPTEVLKVRMPAPNHGDLTVIDWADLPRVRVLAKGVPCQPTSSAGRQLGDKDPRWLWPYARNAVDVLRPEWIAFENVAGLVSYDKGRLWNGILADLVAFGYRVAWGVFGACLAEVGGCHHRHRVFALARLSSTPSAVRWSGKACGAHRGLLEWPAARDGDGRGEGDGSYWDARSARTGRTNGVPLPAQLVQLLPSPRAIDAGPREASIARGDSRVPGVDLGTALLNCELLPTPRATDGVNGGPGQRGSSGDLAMPSAVQPQNFGRYAWAVERWASRFGAPPAPTELGPRGGVRIAPAFPEWMMGYAPGYVTDILGRNDALKAIGNAVFPLQAYTAFRLLAPLLTA